jgi:hypothetical protein
MRHSSFEATAARALLTILAVTPLLAVFGSSRCSVVRWPGVAALALYMLGRGARPAPEAEPRPTASALRRRTLDLPLR